MPFERELKFSSFNGLDNESLKSLSQTHVKHDGSKGAVAHKAWASEQKSSLTLPREMMWRLSPKPHFADKEEPCFSRFFQSSGKDFGWTLLGAET